MINTNKLAKYVSENPYEIYGDYNDELSEEAVEYLIQGRLEDFYDYLGKIDDSYWDYLERDDYYKQVAAHFEVAELTGDEIETVDANFYIDTSNVLNCMFGNTKCHVVATPTKSAPDEPPIDFPHFQNDSEHNTAIRAYNKRTHGWNDIETCYSFDILKVCGTLDLEEVYNKLQSGYKLSHVKLKGSLVTHNSWNGSGGDTLPNSKSTKFYKANFRNDEEDKYGVQEVFGFVEDWWSNQLEVRYTKCK